jgi:hypothetical protein
VPSHISEAHVLNIFFGEQFHKPFFGFSAVEFIKLSARSTIAPVLPIIVPDLFLARKTYFTIHALFNPNRHKGRWLFSQIDLLDFDLQICDWLNSMILVWRRVLNKNRRFWRLKNRVLGEAFPFEAIVREVGKPCFHFG